MLLFALQTADTTGQIERIATTFGVDWPHLFAQSVSFGIVCAILYRLAYKPILRSLETRRQQIAAGLANADKIKAELARIETERLTILARAGDEARALIEDARVAAARVAVEERRKATASAEQILTRAQEAAGRNQARAFDDARREVARLVIQTAASVTGKILTADDQRRLAEETASRLAAV